MVLIAYGSGREDSVARFMCICLPERRLRIVFRDGFSTRSVSSSASSGSMSGCLLIDSGSCWCMYLDKPSVDMMSASKLVGRSVVNSSMLSFLIFG